MELRSRRTGRRERILGIVGLLILLFVGWQLIVVVFEMPGYLLPAPVDVAYALWKTRTIFLQHTLVTVGEILVGYGTGITLGVTLAMLMNRSDVLQNALFIPIVATQTTPVIAIAPILIIWFGVGLLPKVIIITIFSFFPVLVNTLAGLQATGRQMVQLLESVAASEWQVYRYIRIPMALPHIFAGLRLAAASSVIGAVVVEWVASTAGLGYLLILFQSRLNVDRAFATLFILMSLGLIVFTITTLVEHRFSWSKRLGIE
jgi:NitT/TauT family transport system permease protein